MVLKGIWSGGREGKGGGGGGGGGGTIVNGRLE